MAFGYSERVRALVRSKGRSWKQAKPRELEVLASQLIDRKIGGLPNLMGGYVWVSRPCCGVTIDNKEYARFRLEGGAIAAVLLSDLRSYERAS